MNVEAVVQDAFAHLGVALNAPAPTRDGSIDLLVGPDVAPIPVVLKHRSLVDAKAAERLLAESNGSEHLLLIVGDRVTEDARRQILNAKAGYLDLRGHIGVRARGIVIDADVPGIRGDRDRTDALAGQAGMEVAANLLMNPTESAAVRGLARTLGRSPSTVSGVLGGLRRDGLINDANAVVGTALFWRMSERWASRRTFLVSAPDDADEVSRTALRMGLEDLGQPGWALTDTAAAAAYGAPVAFRAGQQLDFLVPDESVLQRSMRLLGPTTSATEAAISVRVAPVPDATRRRVGPGRSSEWPLAHPLFVALDLAQDAGRGREILDAWEPDERWTRVW